MSEDNSLSSDLLVEFGRLLAAVHDVERNYQALAAVVLGPDRPSARSLFAPPAERQRIEAKFARHRLLGNVAGAIQAYTRATEWFTCSVRAPELPVAGLSEHIEDCRAAAHRLADVTQLVVEQQEPSN